MKSIACTLWLAGALFAAGNALASKPQTPAALAGARVISVEEAKKLLDAKDANFVDTRNPVNFGKGHVPGAKLVAYREKSDTVENFDAALDQFDMTVLPADRNAKVVFYSDGPTGWKSFKAAALAVRAGYKNVHYMRLGWADWTAKGLPQEK